MPSTTTTEATSLLPEDQVAAWYMRRKGLHRVPVHAKIDVEDFTWYFYYLVDNGEVELEVHWDADREEWDAHCVGYRHLSDARQV